MTYKVRFLVVIGLGIAVACAPYPKDVATNPAVKAQRFPAESFDGVIEDHVDRMMDKVAKSFAMTRSAANSSGETSSGFTKRSRERNTAT